MLPTEPNANRRRPRLLMCAFSCIPFRGSEPGIGWNRALEAAKYCDTWVICCTNECQDAITGYFEVHKKPAGLHFVYVPYASWAYGRPGQFYLAYRNWLRRAYCVAERLHDEIKFDLTHYVTFSTYRQPGFLWKLNVPYIWGPVGGTQNYPWRCLAGAGPRAWLWETARNLLNSFQLRRSHRVQKAGRAASVVMAANSLIASDLRRFCQIEAETFPDIGLSSIPPPPESCDRARGKTRIIWSGVHEPRKALELLLDSLALIPEDLDFEVRVLGEGVYRRRWQRMAERRGLGEKVKWLGRLPHEQALAEFKNGDMFVFTSLRDTTGTVMIEALGAGLPVVCLDHQGAHDIVSEQCGMKIPVTTRRQIASDLKDAIVLLARDKELAKQLGRFGRQHAESFLWNAQGGQMARVYDEILADSGNPLRCLAPDADEPAETPQTAYTLLETPTLASS